MSSDDAEDQLLRSVALRNAKSILLAQQRAEEELVRAKEALELKTQELARSLAMMRATLESTTDGILATDGSERVTAFNEKFARMWGLPSDIVEAHDHRRVLEFTSRYFGDPARFVGRVDEIYASSPPETYDLLELADGRVFERFSRIQFVDERNVGRVWNLRDITEARRAEEAARKQSEWWRVTLASIGDAVVTTDTEGRVTMLNGVAESLTGWTQQEAEGRPLAEVFRIVSEATGQPVESPVLRALRESVAVGLANHTILIAKDDTRRVIDDSAAPIRGADGAVVGCVLVFRDITKRRHAEERESQLRAQAAVADARFRAFFDQGPLFAGIMGVDGTIIESNRLALEACGYTREQVVGKPFWECPWWTPVPALVETIRAASAGAAAGETFRAEMPYYVADGSERVVDIVIMPIQDQAGRVLFIAPTGNDITERRRLENELRKLAADLSDADRRKNEFLAMLAHELRNPLAPIRNAVELLRLKSGDAGVVSRTSDMMHRQVGQMVRLVDDLLDLSRISVGRIELRKEQIELASVVHHAVEAARALYEHRGHAFTVTLPPDPIHLAGDATRLAQVIGNLINNACKFTEKGGRIGLTVAHEGDQAVIRVSDSGVGIARDQLAVIFDMFAQLDTNPDRSQSGLGIGLTLVKKLVELHGGTVEADSAGRGQGSEFIVRLPAPAVQPTHRPSIEPPFAEPHAGTPQRVLVVDDNQDSADSLRILLELAGHQVRTAYDGLEALEMASTFLPHTILLDIGLPKLSGHEVARRIREQPSGREMLLVALTGWGQDEDHRRSTDAGFDTHLVKPVDIDALTKLLARRQARR